MKYPHCYRRDGELKMSILYLILENGVQDGPTPLMVQDFDSSKRYGQTIIFMFK